MKLKIAFALITGLCAASALGNAAALREKPKPEPLRQTWIVTLVDEPLAARASADAAKKTRGARADFDSKRSLSYLRLLKDRHHDVLAKGSSKAKRALTPRFDYYYATNGFALELTVEEAEAIKVLPGVRDARPEFHRRLLTDTGPRWIGAHQIWEGGVMPGPTRGEGVVVGVIDTGLRADHPSFADLSPDGYNHANPRGRYYGRCASGSPGCNDKVIGIYEFTDEAPRDGSDSTGHGTHVASTTLGNPLTVNLVTGSSIAIGGVAPRASLISYKACRRDAENPGSSGTCPGSALIAAIDQAVADQVDVINYSIGGDPFDPWDGIRNNYAEDARSFLNARAAGIVPIVAAGNDGPGARTVSNPGNAPWVIGVAAASHPRRFVNALADVSSTTGGQSGLRFEGVGFTASLAQSRIVHAKDYGNALCGTGESQGTSPSGGSNPFAPNTFHGEIVICVRGTYARVEKGYNVQQAGAGGMILANAASDGETTVGDEHFLPAVHLGYRAGQELQDLVEQARLAGGQVRGRISGAQREVDDARGDVLASFSSRGPAAPFGGWLKPNIVAPGVDILAAENNASGVAFMSGTSMASPHMAGAAALLVALRPDWSVAQIESALLTTAANSVKNEVGGAMLDAHQAGAGRVVIPDAARAGLYLNVSRQDFLAADPLPDRSAPTRLNMPYLVNHRCFEQCDLSRTVTANTAGSWRVDLQLASPATGTVEPQSFELAAGQSRLLAVHVNVGAGRLAGSWVFGQLRLISTAGGVEQRLPVAIFADAGEVPSTIHIDARANSGHQDITLANFPRFDDAVFHATDLARLQTASQSVANDPDTDAFEDPGNGGIVQTVAIPAELRGAPFTFYAAVGASTARQVHFYVGLDNDNDGTPETAETLCQVTIADDLRRCVLDLTAPREGARALWVYARNYEASSAVRDNISIEWAILAPLSNRAPPIAPPAFVATGISRNSSRAPFNLRLSWYEPRMLPNEAWVGILSMAGDRNVPGQMGKAVVKVDAAASMAQSPIILPAANGRVRMRLNPGAAYERLVVDVPPTATMLAISTQGSGNVDLYVAKSAGLPSIPDFPAAPARGMAQGTSIHDGTSAEAVDLVAPALSAGRWYLTPVNAGAEVSEIEMVVRTEGTAPAARLRDNGFYNPARSGHGLFFSDVLANGSWAFAWYTYLEDQTPTWYTATGPAPADDQQSWTAPLYRYTWNGSANFGTVVGQAMVTRNQAQDLTWSWSLDGMWGSEPMVAIARTGCPSVNGTPVDFSGGWYAPTQAGSGFSVFTVAQTETEVAYLYDAQGVPRWLYGQNGPFGSGTFQMFQYRGFCPYCPRTAAITGAVAGNMVRTFSTPRAGHVQLTAAFQPPLSGQWDTDASSLKLTSDLPCQ